MAPEYISFHDQDLADTMQLLKTLTDPRAREVFAMAQRGELYALNEARLKTLRSLQGTIFHNDVYSTPILSGNEDLPFDALPTDGEIQKALIQDISSKNTYRFAPSSGTRVKDAQATTKLLQNISNPQYDERGAIIHMSSPTFDNLHTRNIPWPGDGILGQSNLQMTVAPAAEIFDLEFSQHYYFCTLLTGTKVVVAFPSSNGNPLAL